MNKKLQIKWMVALLVVFIGLLPAFSLQAQEKGLCCVAGKYEGTQINYAKPNCPKPVKEKFSMIIKQKAPCSSVVGGTITDSSGLVNNWTGTLSRGLLRGCCVLEGSFLTPGGDTVKFKGNICLKFGKWQANGTWEEIGSTDPCKGSGTWRINQA